MSASRKAVKCFTFTVVIWSTLAACASASTRFENALAINNLRKQAGAIKGSPCSGSLSRLVLFSVDNTVIRETLEMTRNGLQDPPPSAGKANPWKGTKNLPEFVAKLVSNGLEWCTTIPRISGNDDDGLKYISEMYWLYYRNEAGMYFAQGRDAKPPHDPLPKSFNFLQEFSTQSGVFMDSEASRTNIKQWIDDPRIEITDYQKQKLEEYTSWNDFFTRKLVVSEITIPSRPDTMPDRDYIIVSPTDCIVNPLIQALQEGDTRNRHFINNPLQLDDVLDVKNIHLSVNNLLGHAPPELKQKFVGGTGLSCILLPTTYHHFHAPVGGVVRYAEVVSGPTFGYNDWANLFPANHNPAQPGTDFSQFEPYQRGVVIIEVHYKDYQGKDSAGFVASIPVGLDTIGSVNLTVRKDDVLKRGFTEIGYFKYGGSLDILLFSAGLVTGSIQTRLGNQIGIINTGKLAK